ncbi:ferrochelatase (plasmid) [Roseomonas mucosa]|nr:ferrochelatase [Roseomonas mucosa]
MTAIEIASEPLFHADPHYARAGDPYPEECLRTTAALRTALGLSGDEMPMTFQSRFGREPWLTPATDETVEALARCGVRRIAVICPGFVADCIETLDEIGHELRDRFEAAGGETLTLVPCLNSGPAAIGLLQDIVARELTGWT